MKRVKELQIAVEWKRSRSLVVDTMVLMRRRIATLSRCNIPPTPIPQRAARNASLEPVEFADTFASLDGIVDALSARNARPLPHRRHRHHQHRPISASSMKTQLLAIVVAMTPLGAFAIDEPGPVVLETTITLCRNPYDHIRSMEFVNQDPVAWVQFRKETLADGRCFDIPAGRRVFAMERVNEPAPMECIRVEGETSCAWGLPFVAILLRKLPSPR